MGILSNYYQPDEHCLQGSLHLRWLLPLQADSITNRVVISVGMLDYLAVFVVAFNLFGFGLNVKLSTSTNRCQSTNMRTLRLTCGCRSFYHITCLEPMYSFDGFRIGKCTILLLAPESRLAGITHLAISAPHRLSFSLRLIEDRSGHPDIPLAILFPNAACCTSTHQPECKTRFIACIE